MTKKKTPGECVYDKIMATAAKPKAKKKGTNGRRKGAEWELAVAKKISAWWGGTFRRTPQSGGWHRGGADGKGQLRGDLVQMDGPPFPFCVECKASEKWSLDAFQRDPERSELTKYLRQCWKAAEDEHKIPLLIAKRNSCPPIAILPLERMMATGREDWPMDIQFRDSNGILREGSVVTLDALTEIPPAVFDLKKP